MRAYRAETAMTEITEVYDELAVVRSRLKKIRRTALEASKFLSRVPVDHRNGPEILRMRNACHSILTATRPSVISRASFPECMAVLSFTAAVASGSPTHLN